MKIETINADLLEACKAARDVWDSDSASMDPDEVKAMLTDAIENAEKSPAERARSLAEAVNVISLALNLIEDGATKTAAERLRNFIKRHAKEEKSPNA